MKRIICVLLALLMLILCGCTGKDKNTTVLSSVMKEYLSTLNEFQGIVHEYGEERSNLLFGEKLVAGVFYPNVGIKEMDLQIENWVSETVAKYQTEVAEYGKKETDYASELTVSYESYLSENKYVSVKMSGFFDSPFLAHPVEIIKTFNGDRENGEQISLKNLVGESGYKKLISIVVEKAGINKNVVDENLLDNWILKKNALEIILPQGEYLPMSAGTKTLSFEGNEFSDFIKDTQNEDQNEKNEEEKESEKVEPVPQKPQLQQTDKTKPMLALTFDDGPSAHTERLLEIFGECGGRGTFFVVGNMIDNRTETVKRIVAEGHEIAGHSWNHRQLTNLDEKDIKDQIMSTRAKIYDLTGYDAKLLRPPYGAFNDKVKAVAKELDVALVNWNVDTLDWKNKNADAVYSCIMKEAKDGAIILCHDLHKTTVDAMEKVIPDLIKEGYQLVTVSELLEAKGKNVQAGNVYFNG